MQTWLCTCYVSIAKPCTQSKSGGGEKILLAMPVLLIIQGFYSSFHKLL